MPVKAVEKWAKTIWSAEGHTVRVHKKNPSASTPFNSPMECLKVNTELKDILEQRSASVTLKLGDSPPFRETLNYPTDKIEKVYGPMEK